MGSDFWKNINVIIGLMVVIGGYFFSSNQELRLWVQTYDIHILIIVGIMLYLYHTHTRAHIKLERDRIEGRMDDRLNSMQRTTTEQLTLTQQDISSLDEKITETMRLHSENSLKDQIRAAYQELQKDDYIEYNVTKESILDLDARLSATDINGPYKTMLAELIKKFK